MISASIFEQIHDKATEGLALAKADKSDGAIMVFQWCNKAFCRATGYDHSEIIGQRGTLVIGRDLAQETHLTMIEKLMNWEQFSVKCTNNRKNGDVMRLKMSWSPLTDPETSERWWLWSMIELDELTESASKISASTFVPDNHIDMNNHARTMRYLEKENRRLQELATAVTIEANEDALTGLSNRRHFELETKAWNANLRSKGIEFAVFYIDLDDFKIVNDTLGHEAGDQLLMLVAEKLRKLCCDGDFIARLGGDEFVILRKLGESALNISGLADNIVGDMQLPFKYDGKSTICTASVGVAIANARMERPERATADADSALYHSKSLGKNRWSFFTEEMHARAILTKDLASDLLIACERKEFIPFFQPLIDTVTGHIASAEVLVRWAHPTRGLLQPNEFLGTAADIGVLHSIDAIVFRQIRESLAFLDSSGVKIPRVSVNVSAGRLQDCSFIHDLKSSGIPPERIVIEILESVSLEQLSETVSWTIDELTEMGVKIAIDDFGTGHASVQGLLKIKPAILKIDRQFIRPIVEDETSLALVESIIGIGKSLGLKIVAEGVETEAHGILVRNLQCEYAQGYYFGRPMDENTFKRMLVANQGEFWPQGQSKDTF